MNVLERIVIPRTKASINYILTELEEVARENFFRFKKILEVKKRSKKGNDEEEPVITCPYCLKEKQSKEEVVIPKCIICGAPIQPDILKEPPKEKDPNEEERLQEFKTHIKEIIDISKDIEDHGILSESVEEFLHSAEVLKEKLERQEEIDLEPIPSDVDITKLCEKCKNRFEEEQAAKIQEQEPEEPEQEKPEEVSPPVCLHTPPPVPTPILPPCSPNLCELHAQLMQPDLELGTFETEIQQIVKIIRIKNDDGSVTEEKKVVRIKKEVRAPVNPQVPTSSNIGNVLYQPSDVSSKSNPPYPDKKTLGIMTIDTLNYLSAKRSAYVNCQSDLLPDSFTMTDPSIKDDHSSTSTIYAESDIHLQDFACMSRSKPSVDILRTRSNSEDAFKSIMSFIGPIHERDKNAPKREADEFNFTQSERRLLAEIFIGTVHGIRISKSANNVTARKRRRIVQTVSLSFDIRRYIELPANSYRIT